MEVMLLGTSHCGNMECHCVILLVSYVTTKSNRQAFTQFRIHTFARKLSEVKGQAVLIIVL